MLDEIIKQNLIDDIIDIVDPPQFNKKELIDVLSERIAVLEGGKRKLTRQDDLIDIGRILNNKKIRKIGEMPQKIGLFEMVAPSDSSN